MKSYTLIKDARLVREFGRTHMDQVLRILRSDDKPSKYSDLSKDEIALVLFVIFSVSSPTDALRAVKNYHNIVHLNKKFKAIWKRFLFETAAQKELVNEISRIWFGQDGSFVIVHFRNQESQTFALPGYDSKQVQNVRIINAEFLWSLQLQLQQPEYIEKGHFVSE